MTEDKKIEDLKKYILQAEESLEAAKKALFEITGEDLGHSKNMMPNPGTLKVAADGKVIEGIFNGENMIGPEGKIFPVPANYASKSKLIEGDKLKLTVAEDGSFIFKQIGPAERKKLVGELLFQDNMYLVKTDTKNYHLLYAAVSFHKAKPGDQVTIIVPATGDSGWAALENIIHDVAPTEVAPPNPEDTINLDLPAQSEIKAQNEVESFFGQSVAPALPQTETPLPIQHETVIEPLSQTPIEPPTSSSEPTDLLI